MSVSTGRMSRADAARALEQIQPAIREFLSPDAPPATYAEALACEEIRSAEQSELDCGKGPNASEIRALRTRVAALQFSRYAASTAAAPRVTSAAVVTLYGMTADNLPVAAGLAANHLGVQPDSVRLQDSSHVRTATLTGTRYTFTTQAP